jgi:site-specific DNA-methyltransferase (adenine-specific)
MNLIQGDCLEKIREVKDIDLVVVDLPYGQTACKWDSSIDLKTMWSELKKVCKTTTTYVFFCNTKFGLSLILSNKKWFRYDIVWEKSKAMGYLSANKAPLRKHEMVYIFRAPCKRNNPPTYNPQKTPGKPWKSPTRQLKDKDVYGQISLPIRENKTGDRHPTSIIKFNNDDTGLHRTQKPVKLCEWLIKSYSNEGDHVLDFTMGSGTTGEACKNTNRRFTGIEKDPEIFEIARQRLATQKNN